MLANVRLEPLPLLTNLGESVSGFNTGPITPSYYQSFMSSMFSGSTALVR